MTSLRTPAVAGMFYPENARECADVINSMLQQAEIPETPAPKAIIVPHAGYIYSGPIAAVAYKKLAQYRQRYKRVVLLGPSHRVAFHGIAVPDADTFRTPLGDISVDMQELAQIRKLPGVVVSALAHQYEHSLEVQLPFLQSVLSQFTLVPLVVGDANARTVATIIEHFWQQAATLIVVSSDLSHYFQYDEARSTDSGTAGLIEQCRPVLVGEQACGCNAINGLLLHAGTVDAQVECVDLRNSGDTVGDHSRVVGYGAFIIY